jgi:hypothetical protein
VDHLELPWNPKHLPISIAFIVHENYVGGELKSYPQWKGWTNTDVTRLDSCHVLSLLASGQSPLPYIYRGVADDIESKR